MKENSASVASYCCQDIDSVDSLLYCKFQNDVQERKNYMKMKDLQRRKNEPLNDLEEEERSKRDELKQMAMEKLQEQEDEIKKLNEVGICYHSSLLIIDDMLFNPFTIC